MKEERYIFRSVGYTPMRTRIETTIYNVLQWRITKEGIEIKNIGDDGTIHEHIEEPMFYNRKYAFTIMRRKHPDWVREVSQ